MRLTHKEVADHLQWVEQLKILPDPGVARQLVIRALKDLQEIDKALEQLHDEVYEGVHHDDCTRSNEDDCDCGYETICELLGIGSE